MFWADTIVQELGHHEIINDSKTPSGRVHIGSLRGLLIHYIIYKILDEEGKEPQFFYGIDDYDPMDELSHGLDETWRTHMGKALVNVPSPESSSQSLSDYYMDEFLGVMEKLDIHPQIYKMSDYYNSGKMNELLSRILEHSDRIREIYYRVSGSKKASNWIPLQVICERCQKLGTTLATAFDGKEVQYTCSPTLVKWAKGCGYKGKVSPFDGRGKLPWKLEWLTKWKLFSVSVEGAGKDHSSQGGSRDVASAIYQEIFHKAAPYNIAYEFFLTGKKKMSSSKGIGLSSADLLELLAPELVRFLMLRYNPQTVIDFHPEGETIPKLYDEYDRCAHAYIKHKNAKEALSQPHTNPPQKPQNKSFPPHKLDETEAYAWRAFEVAQIREYSAKSYWCMRFSTLANLVQLPQINISRYAEKYKGNPLLPVENKRLLERVLYVRKWLETWASENYRFALRNVSETLDGPLSEGEKCFLRDLCEFFQTESLSPESVHQAVYKASQDCGLQVRKAFCLLYEVFVGKTQGPRLGAFLCALGAEFVCARLSAVLQISSA